MCLLFVVGDVCGPGVQLASTCKEYDVEPQACVVTGLELCHRRSNPKTCCEWTEEPASCGTTRSSTML